MGPSGVLLLLLGIRVELRHNGGNVAGRIVDRRVNGNGDVGRVGGSLFVFGPLDFLHV